MDVSHVFAPPFMLCAPSTLVPTEAVTPYERLANTQKATVNFFKQLVIVVPLKCFLNSFRQTKQTGGKSGLMCIWCSSECLRQQDEVRVGSSQIRQQCVCVWVCVCLW